MPCLLVGHKLAKRKYHEKITSVFIALQQLFSGS